MRNTGNVEGTKIAEAALELDVTSVTIRRYLTEFNISTQTDKNGIKILPKQAMDELREVRRLKDKEGLNNSQVLEMLDKFRSAYNPNDDTENASSVDGVHKIVRKSKASKLEEESLSPIDANDVSDFTITSSDFSNHDSNELVQLNEQVELNDLEESILEYSPNTDSEIISIDIADHKKGKNLALTCQTCGKGFEHSNPKLRDCLDCYRLKRKERRKTNQDKQRNVISHPLVNKVIGKNSASEKNVDEAQLNDENEAESIALPSETVAYVPVEESSQPSFTPNAKARSYKRAIEETRQITGSIKRRLERPDLPESDRRWLEQIYAYQLILHQGWKHLSEYKNESREMDRNENANV